MTLIEHIPKSCDSNRESCSSNPGVDSKIESRAEHDDWKRIGFLTAQKLQE